VRALGLEIATRQMQLCQGLAHRPAMTRARSPDPQPIEKCDDRRRTARDLAEHTSLFVFHRLRTGETPSRKMLHQTEEEREVFFSDTFLVERENEISGAGVHQEI